MAVAEVSIRLRILKDNMAAVMTGGYSGCRGLDPCEDTESLSTGNDGVHGRGCRGLDPSEDTESEVIVVIIEPVKKGCRGLDPCEDTESQR